MNKINWRQKLSSRKFWVLVAGLVSANCVLFGVDEDTTAKIVAIIGQFGAIIAYLFAEAYVDKHRQIKNPPDSPHDTE